MDCFVRSAKHYASSRDINIRKHYTDVGAKYLSIQKGISEEEAREFLVWALKNQHIPSEDPKLVIFRKDENRDRYEDGISLNNFLQEVSSRRLLLAPTLTSYLPKDVLTSETSGFTAVEFDERKRIKKEGQVAATYGRVQEAVIKAKQQNKKKESINSISGTFSIPTNPIYNRSGHSTLTSTCRISTALANVNTERLLSGRRYFGTGEEVLENLATVLTYSKSDEMEKVIEKYGFHLVTEDELLECLKYSYNRYWRSEVWDKKIYDFICKLTPVQRSIYLYSGDFYHLRKYNEAWVRNFVDQFHQIEQRPYLSPEETKAELKACDEFYTPFVAGLVADAIGKLSIHAPEHVNEPYYGRIGAAARYAREIMMEYGDYFELFWTHDLQPPNAAAFPHAVRDSVLGGDTDSVLFNVLNWTMWYHGTHKVEKQTTITAMLMIYLLSMVVKHALGIATGTMGVSENDLFRLKMKNEFYFLAFAPSNRTKHYINLKGGCEGINYPVPDLEVKGVALKNSKSRPEVMELFEEMITEFMTEIGKGNQISLKNTIRRIADIEADIYQSVLKGDVDYLPSRNIKVKEAYSIPMSSDYASYVLWEEVFADKYGHAPEPPYEAVRIALNLPNPTAINYWLDTFEDKVIAEKFRHFVNSNGRKAIASILLPYDTLAQSGIPAELRSGVNFRKIIYSSTEPYYILLEMMGYYMLNRWRSRMCLDYHPELLTQEDYDLFSNPNKSALDAIRQNTKNMGKMYDDWDTEAGETIEEEELLQIERELGVSLDEEASSDNEDETEEDA